MLEGQDSNTTTHHLCVNGMVDRWLFERQQLISLYFELTGNGSDQEQQKPLEDVISHTCEILVDYVSAGHFEIYEQLLEEGRLNDNDGALDLARRLMPRINQTTEAALQFNDKYGNNPSCRLLADDFKNDLSQIGQTMEERFEMEDMLIEALHKVDSEETA